MYIIKNFTMKPLRNIKSLMLGRDAPTYLNCLAVSIFNDNISL